MGVLIKFERILDVSVFDQYGTKTIYPENELARKFTRLLEQKTLTPDDLVRISDLGFCINAVTRKEKK